VSETKAAMFKALAALQAEMPKVVKNKTAKVRMKAGGEYSYKYADLADVSDAILPCLARHGLAFISRPTWTADGRFVLAYSLVHESGEREDGEYPLPAGLPPQETGSAITYGRRYALTSATGIAADEDDDAQMAQHSDRADSAGDAFAAASTERPKQDGGRQWKPRDAPAAQEQHSRQAPAQAQGGQSEDEWVRGFLGRLADADDAAVKKMRIEVARASSTEKLIGAGTAKEMFAQINKRVNELDGQAAA
jgi:hypothetical protein